MNGRSMVLLVAVALLLPAGAWAQEARITGQVTAESGEPLVGAAVLIEELSDVGAGTITRQDGRYLLIVPQRHVEGQTVTLVARTLGHKTQRQTVTLSAGRQSHDFTLAQDALELDELVVTGVAGEMAKNKLPFSVDVVDEEQIQMAPPATNPVSALQGRVSGVQIVRPQGTPGTGVSVRLRGVTSITGSSSPLFIVDGVTMGGMIDIDALDVKSIEVVKGAAAASIYGSRAQNGVVRITTNRGTRVALGQTRINVNSEFGVNLMGRTELRARYHDRMVADSAFTDAEGNAVAPGDWLRVNNAGDVFLAEYSNASRSQDVNGLSFVDNPYPEFNDHLDRFFDPGNFIRNSVAISQNREDTNFRLSFGRVRESGVIAGVNGYTRNNARVNIDHSVLPELKVSLSGYASLSDRDDPRTGGASLNPWAKLFRISPAVSLDQRNEDGELEIQPDESSGMENPLYLVENADMSVKRKRMTGNVRVNYAPVSWLDLEGSVSYKGFVGSDERFWDKGFKTVRTQSLNGGRYTTRVSQTDAWDASAIATLRKRFGDLSTRTRIKFLAEKSAYHSTNAGGTGLAAKGVRDLSNIAGDLSVGTYSNDVRGLYGFIATDLDFRDRYVASLLVRRDGSSKFGPEERWHTYYRASGAYRISEESWWPFEDALNEFKLRYSYGTAGGQPGYSAQYETYNVAGGRIFKQRLGNSKLQPEFQIEQSVGLDLALFDRVSAELTYAKSTVQNQLLRIPLAGYYGYNTQWRNAGEVQSHSFEADLNASILERRDLSWSAGLAFSKSTSWITEFNRTEYRTGPYNSFFYREGEEFGTMYGARYIRGTDELPEYWQDYSDQFQVNDEGFLVAVGQENSWRDGIREELWGTEVDIDGDGEPDYEWGMPIQYQNPDGSNDVVIGQSIPDFNVGANTNLRWKDFGVFMLWDAQVGGDVYNYLRHWIGNNYYTAVQNGKSDELKKPTRYYNSFRGFNNRYVEDGTYLKLRELSVSYRLNDATLERLLANRIGVNGVTLSLTGRNLLTLTDYTGYDPEVGRGGNATLVRFEGLHYPNFRTLTGKINITF